MQFFVLSEQTLRSKSPRNPHANEERWEERGREIQCDFWYSPDGKILPNSPGITISYFFSLKAVYFCRDHRRDYLWLAVT